MPRIDYTKLTDEELVNLIKGIPHNEEAALYLIRGRYENLLLSVYYCYTNCSLWYDDCVQDMLLNLSGKNKDWHGIETFEWRSTFGAWLKTVASRDFPKTLKKLSDSKHIKVSIDGSDTEGPVIQIPDDYDPDEEQERIKREIRLLEAISKLEEDDKFIVLKKLEGFSTKMIVPLLELRWKKYNIKKYNRDGELVVPSVGYIDTHLSRARLQIKELMKESE